MEFSEFMNKHIIVEFKDGEVDEGILIDEKQVNDFEEDLYYSSITIRKGVNDYRLIYTNEIDSVLEKK